MKSIDKIIRKIRNKNNNIENTRYKYMIDFDTVTIKYIVNNN